MRKETESSIINQIKQDFSLIALEKGHSFSTEEAQELKAWLKRLSDEMESWCGESCEQSVAR